MVKLATGQIPNFFSVDKVQSFVKNFARLNSHTNSVGNHYHGIGPDHLGYLFVKKQLLNPILDYFNITAELVFAFYLDCVAPIGPHCDMHQLPGPGEHWRSFLIPYSVDNQTSLCGYASTAVLHQWGYSAIEDLPDLDTNLLPYQADLFSHVSQDVCKKFSLCHNAIWHPGDLIYWDSKLAHLSNNFKGKGFISKQAIVVHTYLSH
jgi:hypothetical protein